MRIRNAGAIVCAGMATMAAGPALAQAVEFNPEGNLVAPHNTAVLDRPQVGYEPLGMRFGVFRAAPSLIVTSAFTDNEKAAETDRHADLVSTISPRFSIGSDWSVHALSAFAALTQTVVASAGEDNSTEYAFGAHGRYDVSSRIDFVVDAQRERLVEPRESPNVPVDTTGPLEYTQDTFQALGEARFNQIQLSGSARVINLDYGTIGGAGRVYDFNFRDGSITTLTGTVGHPLSPLTGVFGQVSYDMRRFTNRAEAASRDTDQVAFLVGAVVDLPLLIRGDVAIGYQKLDYQGAFSGLGSSGLRVRGSLSYFPTQLTTVTLTALRGNVASGVIESPGRETTELSGKVDHELLRNVRLNGRIGYRKDVYDGISRDDTILDVGAGADYALNRRVSVSVGYAFLSLASDGANRVRSFDESRVNLALTLHY